MGYTRHHAIIVTSWSPDLIAQAHDQARAIFPDHRVSVLLQPDVNSFQTFLVGPDGSNEGWGDSDTGDQQRVAFIEAIEQYRYDDGSTALAWAEVQYGDERGDDRVLRTHETPRPHPACVPASKKENDVSDVPRS